MYNFIVRLIATFFFVGYTPFIPGTLASGVAIFFIWSLRNQPFLYILVTFVITMTGFLVSSSAERILGQKDARQLVIDEVSGMFVSLLFLPVDLKTIFCAFILFRITDAMKVFPADRLEHLSGARGVMLDDLTAGIYTNLILQAVFRFAL